VGLQGWHAVKRLQVGGWFKACYARAVTQRRGRSPAGHPKASRMRTCASSVWPIRGGAVDLAIRASRLSDLRESSLFLRFGGPPWDALDRLSVVAFAPSHGMHRADVAKKPLLASQFHSVAFRAVGARLTAALTHHDSALQE
jgi:hypothetical protein